MAQKALYRIWRPQKISEVIGQEHITRIISGQIASGKVAHAYLFAGPRGTGKTSLAKILALAINCPGRKGAEPCGTCSICQQSAADTVVDIVEIDAASNNGVDSVRDIRDRVSLLPAQCTYKVYIIDEVHMLSKGAFNALLKTLEEPPPHVIFILATTEPHKLPATIRSRCQRFDFRRISVDTIAAHLSAVAKAEGYAYNDAALRMIARAAEGGMRDALSILDQCVAAGDLTVETVTNALGGGDMQLLYDLADRITDYDEKGALMQLRAILDAGVDTRTLIKDLADIFSRMMWLSVGADTDETDERLVSLAQRFGKTASIRALDLLIKKEYEMRINLRADIVLETAVMGIMAPEDDEQAPPSLRLDKLEARLAALEAHGPVSSPLKNTPELTSPQKASAERAVHKASAEKAPQTVKREPKTPPHNTATHPADMADVWTQILGALKEKKYFVYTHAHKAHQVLRVGQTLELKFDSVHDVEADYMKQTAAQNAVLAELHNITGESLSISVVTEAAASDEPLSADILRMFGTDIEQI